MVGRGSNRNYGGIEGKFMLDILQDILPVGPEEWNKALDRHSKEYPGHSVISIRRRYNTLHRKSIPTGDPNCPPQVAQAKYIKYKIGEKASLMTGGEEFDIVNGYGDDEDDEDIADNDIADDDITDDGSDDRVDAARLRGGAKKSAPVLYLDRKS